MNRHNGAKSYRIWIAGTQPQLEQLNPYLEERPELASKVLIFLCPSWDAARELVQIAHTLGLDAEPLAAPLDDPTAAPTAYGLPRTHATSYLAERRRILNTWVRGEGFTTKQIARLTGIKHPALLIRSMIALGQLQKHGSTRGTYYTLGPNRL